MEVRLNALRSQYEGRFSRQERELRDLRGQQERQEQRDEPQEAGPSKVRVCFNSNTCLDVTETFTEIQNISVGNLLQTFT